MRIAVFGVGGVGGYFGARLAQGAGAGAGAGAGEGAAPGARSGHEVVLIARGAHLAAIRERGLLVETPAERLIARPALATNDPAEAGAVDVVLLAVKAWQVPDTARALAPLLGRETFVVPLQNGVEAASQLVAALGAPRVLGGLCGTISFVAGPGHIRSVGATHFVRFGELDNRPSERAERLREAFARAGVDASIPADIHVALWEKFAFVVSVGGLGAVTRAPIGVLRGQPETRALIEQGIREIVAVGRARGVPLRDDVLERTLAFADRLAPSGTASLQRDIADGKPSELEAWNGAVVRLGREAGVSTPLHAFIYHCLLPLERRARGELEFPE